jgi:hypothetical protein
LVKPLSVEVVVGVPGRDGQELIKRLIHVGSLSSIAPCRAEAP